ncbi:MAG: trypsin-like peptidase domain-containing protein [bacterium]|nr:trypsin-like peptidase domain-containing protein [bacterium]
MSDPVTANTVFPEESLYRGVEIVRRKYDVKGPGAGGSDFALVKLDRRVKGREIVCVSDRSVFYEQPVYVLGFPCGLPVKYAPGPVVESVGKAYFMACMDVYSGNSGSPVFDAESHELVGIVSRADCRDFRWLGDCVVSIIYPNSKIHSEGSRCTRVGEFKSYMSLKS